MLRSELAFSVSWTRGYALKYDDDLRPITSVDDVQAIFAEVGSLEKEAAGLGRFIFGPRNMDMTEYTMRLVSGSVAKAYGCLKDLSSSVHDALRLGSGGKTGPEDQPSYHAKLTVDAFEKAIADTENGSGAMFELQETVGTLVPSIIHHAVSSNVSCSMQSFLGRLPPCRTNSVALRGTLRPS